MGLLGDAEEELLRLWVYQGDGLGQTFQLQSEHLRLMELSGERQELFGTVPVLLLWAQDQRPLLERHVKH